MSKPNVKRIRKLRVKRLTLDVQRRLEAFGFRIVWTRIGDGFAEIGYK